MKLPITLVVLTYNEELNLVRCLKSAEDFASQIIVVDSGSADKTVEIAREHGAEVHVHTFTNQAEQFNWALDHLEIKNEWILRLDADEAMTPELWAEIGKELPNISSETSGFHMKRRVHFMGRWIRYGGYYPKWFLRLFRKGVGRFEDREMDEHVVLSRGRAIMLENDIIENDKRDLTTWIAKHNGYALREARAAMRKTASMEGNLEGEAPERTRWFKEHIYERLPLFVRPFLYFFYRYIILAGFLDGLEGFIFHTLQAFWYRFLVDAKIWEQKITRK